MRTTWRSELPPLALLAWMVAAAAGQWHAVPDRVPVHWGIGGEPDGWGGRAEGLLLLPAIAVGTYVLLLVLPRLDPRRAAYAAFAGAYRIVRLVVLGVLAAVQLVMIETFHGAHVDMTRVTLPLIGIVFVVVGAVMPRLEPNWFVGIRTPWTLSSARSWKRTHALGGPMFVGVGLVWIAAGLAHAAWAVGVAIAAMLVTTLALTVISYREWKRDPDPHAPAPPQDPRR